MFDSDQSRKEFLTGLRQGRLNPQLLSKAEAELAAFASCPAKDFLWALGHANADVRRFGSRLFKICQDPAKTTGLVDLWREERRPSVAEAYLSALVSLGSGSVFAAVAKLINDRNPENRKRAADLLTTQEGWIRQKPLVEALLEDPRSEISEPILVRVAATAPAAYQARLRRLATHPQPEIRSVALEALISLGRIDHAELLLARLPHEGGELKKKLFDAVVALIRREASSMTRILIEAAASTDSKVARTAMDFAVKLPDKKTTLLTLLRYGDSVSAMMRDQLYAMAATYSDSFVDSILEIFRSERDSAMRFQAMIFATVLKHPKLAPVFLHELKNPDWMVRYTAMGILAEMKSQQALPAIVEALGNPESSIAAIRALDKYRDIRLAKPLLKKLNQGNPSEQLEILKVLKNLEDARLLNPLAAFLESRSSKGATRLAAARTIIDLCEATGTVVPQRVFQIHEQVRERNVEDLPDLGLKLAD